ncbi:hypothetical protein [Photobacterium lipolyticum]|uniref:Uncharacterized protein n=1 Tax=Photobacterium lipolyticum TaxID=266810 RepID=A0A2T3N0D3_9GAMM|nr:hypothetical protein [Photobacterium lipolyticum]PSW05729.1 hypothetical protein C9I89_08310 [Photobacterium lipolyticum]
MRFDVQGEMDIEVNGEPIHLSACDSRFELVLPQLSTIATLTRAFPHLPMGSGRLASIRQAMSFCDHVTIKVEDRTVMTINRRQGRRFLSLTRNQVAFENKKLWLKDSFKLIRHYFRQPGLPKAE